MESNPNPPVEGRQSQEATRCPTNREKQSLTYSQQPMDRSPKRSQNCTSSELSRGEKANDPGSAGRPGRTLMPLASTCRTNDTVASSHSPHRKVVLAARKRCIYGTFQKQVAEIRGETIHRGQVCFRVIDGKATPLQFDPHFKLQSPAAAGYRKIFLHP